MSSQRAIFFFSKKKNLQILSLLYFLPYLEAGQFSRNLKVDLSKTIGIDSFGL